MEILQLEKGKIVIIRAESKTGILLNNDGNYYLNTGQNYYLVFNSLAEAKKYALDEIKKVHNFIEYCVYSHNGLDIEFIELIR
jgi:hypothetical protein